MSQAAFLELRDDTHHRQSLAWMRYSDKRFCKGEGGAQKIRAYNQSSSPWMDTLFGQAVLQR